MRAFIALLFRMLCLCSALSLLAAGLVVMADGWQPWAYLLDIFTVPVLTVGVIGVVLLGLLRQGGAAIIGTLGVLCLYLSLAPDVRPPHRGGYSGPVRIVFANLLIRNPTPEALIPWIEAQSPDVVTLVEANQRAHERLIPKLKKTYPYVARRYDMYILSRHPIDRVDGREPGFALLTTRVKTPEGNLTVGVAHLTRPWPFTEPDDQIRQLRRLKAELEGRSDRLILTGDFNSAAPTGPMRDMRTTLGLSAVPAFTGTWPSPLPGPLRIGIDHIMVGPELEVSDRRTGPLYGSDHSPVRADIRLLIPDA